MNIEEFTATKIKQGDVVLLRATSKMSPDQERRLLATAELAQKKYGVAFVLIASDYEIAGIKDDGRRHSRIVEMLQQIERVDPFESCAHNPDVSRHTSMLAALRDAKSFARAALRLLNGGALEFTEAQREKIDDPLGINRKMPQ